jgi:NTP pyrophosphatase (non-canonical NTP hydrolase)
MEHWERNQKEIENWKNLNNKPKHYLWEHELGWLDREMERRLENMNTQEYMQRAIALESNDYTAIGQRLSHKHIQRILHALLGLCTETGELQDSLKKALYYGKDIDRINIKEEIGDLLWYINLLIYEMGFSWEEVMLANIEKLEFRYKDKQFKESQALNRDLNEERRILEK